jgi:FlaA1/EpsC-like NDP-sugar epimerase
VKIVDLAGKIIGLSGYDRGRDIEIAHTGIRHDETLFEEILASDEAAIATKYEKILVSEEDRPDAEMFPCAIYVIEDTYRTMGREIGKKLEGLVQTEWQDIVLVIREEMLRAGAEAAA